MTSKEDIIRMAREAGFMPTVLNHWPAELERLVELVTKKTVEAERQAFIEKIQAEIDHAAINDTRLAPSFGKREGALAVRIGALEAALDAIRARGQA
jgi:hypothetical protein